MSETRKATASQLFDEVEQIVDAIVADRDRLQAECAALREALQVVEKFIDGEMIANALVDAANPHDSPTLIGFIHAALARSRS